MLAITSTSSTSSSSAPGARTSFAVSAVMTGAPRTSVTGTSASPSSVASSAVSARRILAAPVSKVASVSNAKAPEIAAGCSSKRKPPASGTGSPAATRPEVRLTSANW